VDARHHRSQPTLAVRQWSRIRCPGHPALAADGADLNGVHRFGQTLAERC
jgi:hypothetical protein